MGPRPTKPSVTAVSVLVDTGAVQYRTSTAEKKMVYMIRPERTSPPRKTSKSCEQNWPLSHPDDGIAQPW